MPTSETARAQWEPFTQSVSALCRGQMGFHSLGRGELRGLDPVRSLALIFVGFSSYGLCMGLGHGWEMGFYVGIKFPLIILLTLLLNGLLNGLLAHLTQSGLGFRDSFRFLMMAFGLMGVVLASLAPIAFFNALSIPDPADPSYHDWHQGQLLGNVLVIAVGGVLSHWRLLELLRRHAKSHSAARLLFIAWLAGNLFVGAQVGWVLRPIFGSSGLEAAWLRPDPLNGSFYETVFRALMNLI